MNVLRNVRYAMNSVSCISALILSMLSLGLLMVRLFNLIGLLVQPGSLHNGTTSPACENISNTVWSCNLVVSVSLNNPYGEVFILGLVSYSENMWSPPMRNVCPSIRHLSRGVACIDINDKSLGNSTTLLYSLFHGVFRCSFPDTHHPDAFSEVIRVR